MSGQFTLETKPLILEALRYVIESNGRALLEIECDYLGFMLQSSLNGFYLLDAHFIPTLIAGQLVKDTAYTISGYFPFLLRDMYNLSPQLTIQKLLTIMSNHHYDNFTNIDRKAYPLIVRQLCSTLGSILASLNINQQEHFTYKKALSFMS
jgi:hypothetical protein